MTELMLSRRLTTAQGKTLLRLLGEGKTIRQAALAVQEEVADCLRWIEQDKAKNRVDGRKIRKANAKYPYERSIYGGPPIAFSADEAIVESDLAAAAFAGVVFTDAETPPCPLKRIDIPPTVNSGHCGAASTLGRIAAGRSHWSGSV